ncbi:MULTISPECIES: ribosome maturation factor RimM [unclassified Paenibacillus]|uniref:ribosome maturation factor RimM n=1 Tax=unclassified Paenibacillus TaxID=185978 RepID=UPI001AE28921|nr:MULTISPECIES: ribosome maturation factor RimM [unclassified Paenibacillus]MBP1156038.1 16S rRNA processing protein RimM [Paenibacillus sp. PvP091]MBP1168576.1 16S rRNA processing protein RimM [Paenibacillus sp. PvR098]MBP2439604.1 16S rRNA processing protein RimM [Paenibacillus sp. PvP052]
MSEKLYTVGKIVNTHGIRGELKIVLQTDFPEERFTKGGKLVFFNPEQGSTFPVTVESSRFHKNMIVARFQGFNDINEVEKYKGWLLKVEEQYLSELEDEEFYYHEIIGCRVYTEEGEELGTISDILSPGANDVWVVERSKGKPLLLPYIDDVVLSVDVEQKRVMVRLMEGLLDL